MNGKHLGKIKDAVCGLEPDYNQFGLHMEFGGDTWGVKWSETCRAVKFLKDESTPQFNERMANVVVRIEGILTKARVRYVHELLGIPVEVVLENNMLKSWRILEEVL